MKYNLQVNEKQLQNLIWGVDLAIDRCCTGEEEEPFQKLMKLLNDCKGGINRQKAEIEKLNIELKTMRGAANSYKAEVERLQKGDESFEQ